MLPIFSKCFQQIPGTSPKHTSQEVILRNRFTVLSTLVADVHRASSINGIWINRIGRLAAIADIDDFLLLGHGCDWKCGNGNTVNDTSDRERINRLGGSTARDHGSP